MQIRRSIERGYADHGWLRSYHTFSFANYMDPNHMGFRALRVINEDRVTPGNGFGAHPHRDMEILSYVLEGEMEHRDNMGNGEVIRPGDVQRMSAGIGVLHSEFNHSKENGLHFLQIWIQPAKRGITPSYEQKHFPVSERQSQWRLVVSQEGREGSVSINQDVNLYASLLSPGDQVAPPATRYAWLHVVKGAVEVNGETLTTGDAAAFTPEEVITLTCKEAGEVLLFDLA
ncbi:pirin family protein [Halomonas sp. GFAJ-1]|uniref:pirin family protein n=1 Tax=Halomonas sp. GFAJ-1 TaxID=1118153 RepID=UPI00023A201D|nr:pirin family protein [Halomonas sp. GFAJ-1]AVI62068.1 quercetin 2,3-dioxygenase [Halomonas sp. GFAJ-1]EHK61258.1 pirin family protein [Halomonas sp. GFAJ-1]